MSGGLSSIHGKRAFTLVELLVVLAIILLPLIPLGGLALG